MLTVIDENDSERVLTIRIREATIDAASGDLTAEHASRLGRVDVVEDTVETAMRDSNECRDQGPAPSDDRGGVLYPPDSRRPPLVGKFGSDRAVQGGLATR
jgi:hypothetical protein